jgi:hypothetical protein
VSQDKPSSRPADGRARRPRRELLAAAAGALGVIAAETVARPAPAQAANLDPVLQGTDNGPATSRTMVFTTKNFEFASLADPNTSGKGSLGVYGHGLEVGVLGEAGSVSGSGVLGNGGSNGDGVHGNGGGSGKGVSGTGGTNGGFGVYGLGGAGNGAGVRGDGNGNGVGVVGTGGPTGGPGVSGSGGAGTASGVVGLGGPGGGTGVEGEGGQPNGTGVQGGAQGTGDGVLGIASGGNGVHGQATTAEGVGVLAENTAGGTALRATGTTIFSRSGLLAVGSGQSTATQTGVALTSASLVLATLQQNRAGILVQAAVPNVAGSSFTVHLSKAVSASTKVAWFVVN